MSEFDMARLEQILAQMKELEDRLVFEAKVCSKIRKNLDDTNF